MDNFDLIRLVKERRALWDRSCWENADATARENLWDEVAAILAFNKKAVKSRWKNLRDSYRKIIKNQDSDHAVNSKWSYFKVMSFMRDVNAKPSSSKSSELEVGLPLDLSEKDGNRSLRKSTSKKRGTKRKTVEIKRELDSDWTNSNLYDHGIIVKKESDGLETKNLLDYPILNSFDYIRYVEAVRQLRNYEYSKNFENTLKMPTNFDYDCIHPDYLRYLGQIELLGNTNKIQNFAFPHGNVTGLKLENPVKFENDLSIVKKEPEDLSVSRDASNVPIVESRRSCDDYQFLMSLYPHLKMVNYSRKLPLRMKMEQLIYEEVNQTKEIKSEVDKN